MLASVLRFQIDNLVKKACNFLVAPVGITYPCRSFLPPWETTEHWGGSPLPMGICCLRRTPSPDASPVAEETMGPVEPWVCGGLFPTRSAVSMDLCCLVQAGQCSRAGETADLHGGDSSSCGDQLFWGSCYGAYLNALLAPWPHGVGCPSPLVFCRCSASHGMPGQEDLGGRLYKFLSFGFSRSPTATRLLGKLLPEGWWAGI